MKRICYISGTRADFGLMQSTLAAIHAHPALELALIVTGMHLLPEFGRTVQDIEAAGLPIAERVELTMSPASGARMASNIGLMTSRFVDALERLRPHAVLLLGDRGEMLAGALAALHLNIPIMHVHGGERSGTIDEPVRHAISKLSHVHCTATGEAAARLQRMGERSANIVVTGAPGLDGLTALADTGRAALCAEAGFDPQAPLALMVYHPVLQEAATAGADSATIVQALRAAGVQVLALMPNSDAGSDAVREALTDAAGQAGVRLVTHLPRARFVSWMAAADLMIGNSSAGIIEAASFGTPVINIGSRQGLRERNANIRDVPATAAAIGTALQAALAGGRLPAHNVYGDGRSAARIVALLADHPFDAATLDKTNAY